MQDLMISRALVEIFSDPPLAGQMAFRGGIHDNAAAAYTLVDRELISPWIGILLND